MISYLDCVQPSTLRVRQSGHVKEESPWKVIEADEEKKKLSPATETRNAKREKKTSEVDERFEPHNQRGGEAKP